MSTSHQPYDLTSTSSHLKFTLSHTNFLILAFTYQSHQDPLKLSNRSKYSWFSWKTDRVFSCGYLPKYLLMHQHPQFAVKKISQIARVTKVVKKNKNPNNELSERKKLNLVVQASNWAFGTRITRFFLTLWSLYTFWIAFFPDCSFHHWEITFFSSYWLILTSK